MWWTIGIIIGCIVLALVVVVLFVDGPNRREIWGLSIGDIDFAHLKDGTYEGEYTGKTSHLRDTKVEITVAGGELAEVKILKGAVDKDGKLAVVSKGKTIGDLFEVVKQSKDLHVDAISGATLTSITHLKALEEALKAATR
jgi:uncharacterized protein with FMN-binding domain